MSCIIEDVLFSNIWYLFCSQDESGEIYYFNFSTGDSVWDHPCDEYFREMVEEERAKLKPAKNVKNKKNKEKKKDKKDKKDKTNGDKFGVRFLLINSVI